MAGARTEVDGAPLLSAQDLLAGGSAVHEVEIPARVLNPAAEVPAGAGDGVGGKVRLRPLSLADLSVVSRAARDDPGLVPVLMVKEAMVEPRLEVAQVRRMHAGLIHHLMERINALSGLAAGDGDFARALGSPLTETQVLLAQHFGWTPEQVASLTPAQVGVYLAGIERLLEREPRSEAEG